MKFHRAIQERSPEGSPLERPGPPEGRARIPTTAAVLALGLAYFGLGKFGLSLAFVQPNATAVWPPAGLALAAVLLLGYRVWPGILLGAFFTNLTTAGTWATSAAIAVGNTGEALAAAYFVAHFAGGAHVFRRTQNILTFSGLSVAAAPIVSATFGVTSLALAGFADWPHYAGVWVTWWLGDAVSILVLTPLVMLWVQRAWPRGTAWQALEAGCLSASVLTAGQIAFGGWLPRQAWHYPLEYLAVPPLVWAAYRFGHRGAATAAFFTAVLAIRGTLLGFGPFVLKGPNESLLLLQTFIATVTFTALILASVESERRRAEQQVRALNADLEQKVAERTAQLAASTRELESFCYSISHDLRAPLRRIDGFSQMILEDLHGQMPPEAQEHFQRIRAASQHMAQLIDDLLDLSRFSRKEMRREPVDMSAHAAAISEELKGQQADRAVEISIEPGLAVYGDEELLKVVLQNLLDNAWKFTRGRQPARIEFGQLSDNGETVFFVRDNGAGFDMTYAGKLFGAFQRLHDAEEFPGTGIGLATVQRILHRHGGRIWAEASPGRGATFFFTIPPGP